MSRRILDETTKSTFASDDYLYMDGQTDGSSKITPDNLVRNTTVAQQLAQHIADAEDEVEQITGDIEGIQSDINDVKSDIGDLADLETTDKSSLVNAINEARGTGGSGSGLTADIKSALLQIAQKVAYIDEHGQDYYDDLYDALYAITAITLNTNSISMQTIGATSQLTATTTPTGGNVTWSSSNTSVATVSASGLVTSVAYGSATITASAGSVSATCSVVVAQATCTGITATYTPSGTVYDSDTLDSLKTDLVVTASWSNGTTTTLTDSDYTLSGTLATGTSTITASFGGQTDTFDVTVVGLTSITATYTQSGTVYDDASLDDLKTDLVVTANYSDSSTATVTDYTLSGTLAEGTSTITVTYGGKTTTFNVTVSRNAPEVVTAINLPYGAYVDTEYIPTSLQHKYLIGVQLLSNDTPAANKVFAGVNRLPSATTATEEYWHVYFTTGAQSEEKNKQYIAWDVGAYKNTNVTKSYLRTANGIQYTSSLITETPFFISIKDGEQQLRADEAMETQLQKGSFSYVDSTETYNTVNAETPIDSFYIGKANNAGLKTVDEYEGGVKIFCFKVYDENDNLLVNMHPALFGGNIGMYDAVRNKFCAALGTGATYDE